MSRETVTLVVEVRVAGTALGSVVRKVTTGRTWRASVNGRHYVVRDCHTQPHVELDGHDELPRDLDVRGYQ